MDSDTILNMKILKYLMIFFAIAGMFYAKSKIDSRNKMNIQTIDSLDDGTEAPKKLKK